MAVGTGSTPTPTGNYFVDGTVQVPDPSGPYGAYQMSVAAFSDVHYSFGGGIGQIAIHGTNDPALLGTPASNGCVRMTNDDITLLANAAPPARRCRSSPEAGNRSASVVGRLGLLVEPVVEAFLGGGAQAGVGVEVVDGTEVIGQAPVQPGDAVVVMIADDVRGRLGRLDVLLRQLVGDVDHAGVLTPAAGPQTRPVVRPTGVG